MARQPLTEAERQKAAQEPSAEELRAKPLKEDSFTRFCKSYGLECTFSVNLVFIRTKVTSWRIYHTNSYVEKVEHESSGFVHRKRKANKNGKTRFGEGFHEQPVFQHDIYAIARYIANHDQWMLRRFTNSKPGTKSITHD